MDVRALLRERFGFDDFRPAQAHVVDLLLKGRSVLAVMPTGSGKSLCFQLPALALPGLTLVVSPLIAQNPGQAVERYGNQRVALAQRFAMRVHGRTKH